jgi:hypothetical protein
MHLSPVLLAFHPLAFPPGQPQPPSRPPALAPPPSIAGFPRGGSPYQYMPPRPMQQVTQQQQQQQFGQQPQPQQPRTPSGATPGGQSPGFPSITGGGAPSRGAGGGSFPFGSTGVVGGGQQQGNLQQLQQGLQNQLNNLSLNPQQQQNSSSNLPNGPPSTTPSHQSLFSHQSDAQSNNNGSSAPSGAGLDPLDFPALSSLGTASQALPPPPTPHSYAAQASNPAALAQSLQQGGVGSRGEFNADDFPALGGDLNGQGGNVMTNGAGALGNGTAMGVVGGGGKFARGVSEDPRVRLSFPFPTACAQADPFSMFGSLFIEYIDLAESKLRHQARRRPIRILIGLAIPTEPLKLLLIRPSSRPTTFLFSIPIPTTPLPRFLPTATAVQHPTIPPTAAILSSKPNKRLRPPSTASPQLLIKRRSLPRPPSRRRSGRRTRWVERRRSGGSGRCRGKFAESDDPGSADLEQSGGQVGAPGILACDTECG